MSVINTPAGRLALACSSAAALMYGSAAMASCTGAGAPSSGFLECLTAVQIPGVPIRTFDISWVDASRGLYFLGDRSNAGVDIIDTKTNKWIGRAAGFVGVQPVCTLPCTVAVNNNISGPDGVVSHGRWLYAGDGNSTLRVYDIANPASPVFAVAISTGGTTRVDEMSMTPDGKLIVVANNAEDPPYVTVLHANGDSPTNTMSAASIVSHVTIDPTVVVPGFGFGFEQSVYDPRTGVFYASLPTINNNPAGCNYGQLAGAITCSGGMAIIDPAKVTSPSYVVPAASVVPLHNCAPNGLDVGPGHDLIEGCTPGNQTSNDGTTILTDTAPYPQVSSTGVTGNDEVWYDKGTNKYFAGASKNGQTNGGKSNPVLGVIDAKSKYTIQTIPVSSNSHSVAADAKRHYVYSPQVAPTATVGVGGDATTNGAGICGAANGCVGVYRERPKGDHDGDKDDDDGKHDD